MSTIKFGSKQGSAMKKANSPANGVKSANSNDQKSHGSRPSHINSPGKKA